MAKLNFQQASVSMTLQKSFEYDDLMLNEYFLSKLKTAELLNIFVETVINFSSTFELKFKRNSILFEDLFYNRVLYNVLSVPFDQFNAF